MKIKQSETIVINRSQINFAPYNPRKKDEKVIELLKKNFKKVGFLGGIVWNDQTGNLVGGHKRVETLDLIYGYPKKDYEIKVEKISVDLKTEKEQNIFLNNKSAQGETDYELLAEMIKDIDISSAALTQRDLDIIEAIVPDFDFGDNTDILADYGILKERTDEEKRKTKENRKKIKSDTTDARMPFYFTVTFDSYMEKAEYLEGIGINGDSIYITSREFLKNIE